MSSSNALVASDGGDDRAGVAGNGPIVRATPESLRHAARLLRRGASVVGYPTETCYGLGVIANEEPALQRLLDVKGRSEAHPISVIVADSHMLRAVVAALSPLAEHLIARFWPGPLTLVLPAVSGLPQPLLNARGGIGVRIPADPIARRLVEEVGAPITATSANRSGCAEARRAADAAIEGVELVLDDGPRQQPPTTVIDLVDRPTILRQGALQVDLG